MSPGGRARLLPTAGPSTRYSLPWLLPALGSRELGGRGTAPGYARLDTFSLLLAVLSLRMTAGISPPREAPTKLLLLLLLALPWPRLGAKPARDVRGRRLLEALGPRELASPLTRRGMPVGPSRLRGR
jgi:hypothetical protein